MPVSDYTVYSRYVDLASGADGTADFGVAVGSLTIINHGPASVYIKFSGTPSSSRADNQPKLKAGEAISLPRCAIRTVGVHCLTDAATCEVDMIGQIISQ